MESPQGSKLLRVRFDDLGLLLLLFSLDAPLLVLPLVPELLLWLDSGLGYE
jgi:hypothetical protein